MKQIRTSSKLPKDKNLYRFIDFKQFISIIEKNEMTLTRITEWEDTWEAPTRRLPVANKNGEPRFKEDNIYKFVYGQCWSQVCESDALWRIYSPNKDGIRLQTTVNKLESALLRHRFIQQGFIAPVVYYDDLLKGLKEVDSLEYPEILSSAFLKRSAFEHEHEVRVLLLNLPQSVDENGSKYINLSIDPNDFIESILVDPRADDWYVDSLVKYCNRINLSSIPVKSDLYSEDVFGRTKIFMRYEVIE